MTGGLSTAALAAVCEVFAANNKIQRVILFGSRAMGTHREGSDVDLAVEAADITYEDLLNVQLRLDELMLPYKFDVIDTATIKNQDLLDHIGRVGKVLFVRT